MRWILLSKVSFWLIVIGIFALVAPSPAWPEWLARMALATGIALGITTVGVRLWNARNQASQRPGRGGPDTD